MVVIVPSPSDVGFQTFDGIDMSLTDSPGTHTDPTSGSTGCVSLCKTTPNCVAAVHDSRKSYCYPKSSLDVTKLATSAYNVLSVQGEVASGTLLDNTDIDAGNDASVIQTSDADCNRLCAVMPQCQAPVYMPETSACVLKNAKQPQKVSVGQTAWVRN